MTAHQNWLVAIVGGTIASVLGGIALYVLLPQQQRGDQAASVYCTVRFATCITDAGGEWRVASAPCPNGKDLRFITVEPRSCHSITPTGFSTALAVCPAVCD